jgi:dCMP deaminase
MRISRERMFADIAAVVAKRSTCSRLNVGAVVVIDNRIVSIGYNGQEPGQPHCDGVCGAGQCNTIHAEINALAHVPDGYEDQLWDLYVTDSPCMTCALHLAPIVERVFYTTPYRDVRPLDFLVSMGVKVIRVLPSGRMVEWHAKAEAI